MKKTLIISLVLTFMLVTLPAMAQSNEDNSAEGTINTTMETDGGTNIDKDSQEEDIITTVNGSEPASEELEGIEVDNITKIPSSMGLWWRGVKENFSLGLTFDPVKKAEKAVKFAEERMKIAELMAANSTDEKVQEKAQRMIERAQTLTDRIESGQAKWTKAADPEKVKRLMKNVVTHQMNKERAMNRIEQGLPEKSQEKFNQLREKGMQASQRLMNALENENIPEETKAKLEAVKARIEEHASTTRAYIEKRKELHKRIKAGEEGAIEELKQLNDDRKDDLKEGLQDFKDIRDSFRATTSMRIRERIENRINDKNGTSSMIRNNTRQQVQASETQPLRQTMPRR